MYTLLDFVTQKQVYPEKNNLVFSGEHSPWEVSMDLAYIKTKISLDYFKIAQPCLSKYLPLMPIKSSAEFVSLQEMATPLVKSKNLAHKLNMNLYFKVEGKNPTGSFKDRGSAVDISVAKEFGAKAVILASTGNMAASCACYAAAAKLPCFVLVPEGVSMGKLAQVIAFGAHVVQVKGSYNDAANLAEVIARKMGFYLAGDYAFRVEGQKSAAFEIIDQLFFQVPDYVVVPVGCGTNITAYAKGFREYYQLGLIPHIPKFIGVQAEGANAVVQSYIRGEHHVESIKKADTIASAIAVPHPIDGTKALDAIYSSGGFAISVTDQEILQAQRLLSVEEGLFAESASAASLAAIMKSEKLQHKKIVCVLTGDGLKDVGAILQNAFKLPMISPDENAFFSYFSLLSN